MSQGQATRGRLILWFTLTIVAGVVLLVTVLTAGTTRNPFAWLLLAIVILSLVIGRFSLRCRQCGHDVTKDAAGVSGTGFLPKVNSTCAKCGAAIP
jgi:hypothetical protein